LLRRSTRNGTTQLRARSKETTSIQADTLPTILIVGAVTFGPNETDQIDFTALEDP